MKISLDLLIKGFWAASFMRSLILTTAGQQDPFASVVCRCFSAPATSDYFCIIYHLRRVHIALNANSDISLSPARTTSFPRRATLALIPETPEKLKSKLL